MDRWQICGDSWYGQDCIKGEWDDETNGSGMSGSRRRTRVQRLDIVAGRIGIVKSDLVQCCSEHRESSINMFIEDMMLMDDSKRLSVIPNSAI